MLGLVLGAWGAVPLEDYSQDRDATALSRSDQPHTVAKGDTLYSIAFRYGLDIADLRRWNGLAPTQNRIDVGQRLNLGDRSAPAHQQRPRAVPAVPDPPVQKGASDSTASVQQKPAPPSVDKPVAASVKSPEIKPPGGKQVLNDKQTLSKPLKWRWPLKGSLGQGYDPRRRHKGIDLIAARGTLVRASAKGKVRHAGTNVPGYGNLVLIEHGGGYMSAYAHLDQIRIARGAILKAGEVIGTLGSSGTDRPHLHFEVRRGHRTVNPMQLLP